jgi:hypothetical protein
MNIRQDIKELNTSARDLRKFGLLVGGVFAALGILFLLKHKAYYPYFLWPGVVLLFFGAVFPRALKYVYITWMSVAFVLGFVMAHVILTLFFFLVLTPIGLVARMFGKDFLRLKLDKQSATYWIRRDGTAKSAVEYERQF